jgi:tRNA(Ile)-lysidine synthase
VDRSDAAAGRGLRPPLSSVGAAPAAPELAALLADEMLARCRFPAAGTAVSCGVSGGADSTALVLLARRAGCLVTAIHVDHGLRPDSAGEAALVEATATALGARFGSVRVEVSEGADLEARARDARHAALPPGALLGHTADDQAETVLWNLLRGAGPLGAAGMPDDGRRPLLRLRRAETAALCRAWGLEVLNDPMNLDPAFTRVRVRHELLPLAADIARRDVVDTLARYAELSGDLVDALDAVVAGVDAADVHALGALPDALAAWAVRGWLGHQTGEPPIDRAGLERVMAIVRGEVRATQIEGGWRVERHAQRLRIVRPGVDG